MTIILETNHDLLTNSHLDTIPSDALNVDHARVTIAVVNLMSNVEETLEQYALAFSTCERDVELKLFTARAKLEADATLLEKATPDDWENEKKRLKLEKAQHRVTYYAPIEDIYNDASIDAILISGTGATSFPLRQESAPNAGDGLSFYNEITTLFDYTRANDIPEFDECWASHAALAHRHNIARMFRTQKLTGVFEIAVDENASILKGVGRVGQMPFSRYGEANEWAIRMNKSLQILATSDQTGAAIVQDGNAFYLSGHLPYDEKALPAEFARDRKKEAASTHSGFVAPRPENVDFDNPKITWGKTQRVFFNNFVNLAFNKQQERLQEHALSETLQNAL